MKLIYRGNTYNYDSSKTPGHSCQPLGDSGKAHNLRYRGLNYYVAPYTKSAENSLLPKVYTKVYKFIYRGIDYFVDRNIHVNS